MSEVKAAWAMLADEGRTEPGWHSRRVHNGSPCETSAAVSAPGDALALLFEVHSRSVPAGAEFPDCIGFELHPETIVPGPGGRVRLCLLLRDNRFRDVFESLAEDVALAVADAKSEALAVKMLLGRLRTWERFVQKFDLGHLSDEQQLGLYAELLCLKDHLIPIMDTRAAVHAWRGPYGDPQDFRFRLAAVEVKATIARNPQSFHVSNLDQLDRGTLELLLVHHLSFDVGSATGWTLPDMVAEVRGALVTDDPVAAADLDASLIEAGYLDVHRPAYEERRYSSRNSTWFKVEGAFPRLMRSTVPAGIRNAEYGVDLQTCARHTVEGATALSMLQGMI